MSDGAADASTASPPLDEGLAALGEAVTRAGLAGASETDLLKTFCQDANRNGLGLTRALVVVDTLHPVHEGRVFRWSAERPDEVEVREYGRTNQGGEMAENWQRSPFFRMLQTGESALRRRVGPDHPADYPILEELRDARQTDWLALINRFEGAIIGEMDCIYSSWSTEEPDGFGASTLKALKRLVPMLGLAVKSASLARIAETLVETYLGRDAGQRVLSGRIERGVADRIDAALWFSDLSSYTRITGAASPDQIIPFLNDYAEAVISAVEGSGGDVLKLIGDGVLAIFKADSRAQACTCALKAAETARANVLRLNETRRRKGLPITTGYLGLHVGEVFYGNVGSRTRLDFTVVGPAVNEVSRIAAMCRSADRRVLCSAAFVEAAETGSRKQLVSVGRYALRGVERPVELFTIVPADGGDMSVPDSGGEPHPDEEEVVGIARSEDRRV